MNADDRKPFPFVVGCGRSGTTLVRAMLDAHREMAVPFESYFPVWFARQRSSYERPEGFAAEKFTADLLAHESFRRWHLDPAFVATGITAAAPTNYPDAVRTAFALYAAAHDKVRYGDKTPIFVTHIPTVAELFPEAVFVHLVRDGRAVVLSRAQASWGTDRLEFETLLWRSQVEQGRADGTALGGRRYREIHYEAILDDPERAAHELCEIAGLEFDPGMLTYHERATTILDDQPFPEEHQNLLRPPTKGLRDWQTELSPMQIELFECLAGDTLEAFGYRRATTTASPTVRARALRARARYESTRQFRRARSRMWHLLHREAVK